MQSTMKTESNTGNSQRPIRNNCSFALGVALLSTSLFASAAHAQSNCAYSRSGANLAAICPATSTTGNVWVASNGTWYPTMYYDTTDATLTYIYHYNETLWSYQNRITAEWFVEAAPGQGTYIPYDVYEANETELLFSLATLAQATGNTGADVTSSAPTITIIPNNPVAEYCSNGLLMQQLFQSRGYPAVPLGSMCGQ